MQIQSFMEEIRTDSATSWDAAEKMKIARNLIGCG